MRGSFMDKILPIWRGGSSPLAALVYDGEDADNPGSANKVSDPAWSDRAKRSMSGEESRAV
ncbi:hypothetical protein SAMN07250955_106247 [Arboricoccus pini]|uniref:Uncharacterized protein n=1 Tax=Arboricoccus pini TaxID=1963835 RepID=A0A212R9E7_9PROT|nr:hypothetical protein SAMN07250955_106247 [Arboricoccus pini]